MIDGVGVEWLQLLTTIAVTGLLIWLLLQTITPHRLGWLNAVIIPLVLAAYTLFAASLETLPSFYLLAIAISAGILFEQNASFSYRQGTIQGCRSPWPYLLWGIGTLLFMIAPAGGTLGYTPTIVEDWGKTIGTVGAFNLIGQTLVWTKRLLGVVGQRPETDLRPVALSSASALSVYLHRFSKLTAAALSLIVIWFALPSTTPSPPQIAKLPGGPTLITYSLDTPNPGLYVAKSDGTAVRRVTSDPAYTAKMWVPDGSAIIAWNAQQQKLLRIEMTGEIRALNMPLFYFPVSWSPDGRWFVFMQGSIFAGPINIYKMQADGSGEQSLTNDGQSAYPSWSTDGEMIAFTKLPEQGSGGGVMIMKPDGSDPRFLTEGIMPTWSPDSQWLAMVAAAGSELRVIRRDGRGLHNVLEHKGLSGVSWSPDGRHLLYEFIINQSPYNHQFGIVRIDGAETKELSQPDDSYTEPQWSPTGEEILYTIAKQGNAWKTELWITDLKGQRRQLSRIEDGKSGDSDWSQQLEKAVVSKWLQESAPTLTTDINQETENKPALTQSATEEAKQPAEEKSALSPPFEENKQQIQNKPALSSPSPEEIKQQPDRKKSAATYNQHGVAYWRQKKWAAAQKQFQQAIALDNTNPEYYNNLGGALDQQEKWKEAEAAFLEAIRLNPTYPLYHAHLGHVFWHQKRWQEAETAFWKAIHFKPDMAVLYNDLGVVFIDQRKWTEAEKVTRQAIKLAPKKGLYHANLADILYRQGRRSEAKHAAQEAIRLGYKEHPVYEALGITQAGRAPVR